MNRTIILMSLLVTWMACLRLFQFGQIPASLNRDEAAIGYNSFSLLHYGIDEWGESYPLIFKSFGDYKLPGYIYADSLAQLFLGTSNSTIRLPSLLSGIGILIILFFIVRRFLPGKRAAFIVMLLVGLQPWTIFYSRMAYEAHLGLFFSILGIWLYTKHGVLNHFLGLAAFILAILTYNSPLLLIPVFLLSLFLTPLDLTTRLARLFLLLIAGIIGVTLLFPIMKQKQNITIFTDPTIHFNQSNAYHLSKSLVEKLWNHRYIYWVRIMAQHTFNTLSPSFLVIKGGQNPWHSAPNTGHIFLTAYCLFFYGMYLILSHKRYRPWRYSVMTLTLGSLLPAITTVDAPHATRSLLFLLMLSTLAGIGLSHVKKNALQVTLILILLLESIMYSKRYFIDFAEYTSDAWPVGLEQSLSEARFTDLSKELLIADESGSDLTYDQIYIYPLLYGNINTTLYQQSRITLAPDAAGLSRIGGFGRVSISGYNNTNGEYQLVIVRNNQGRYELQ